MKQIRLHWLCVDVSIFSTHFLDVVFWDFFFCCFVWFGCNLEITFVTTVLSNSKMVATFCSQVDSWETAPVTYTELKHHIEEHFGWPACRSPRQHVHPKLVFAGGWFGKTITPRLFTKEIVRFNLELIMLFPEHLLRNIRATNRLYFSVPTFSIPDAASG